MAFQMAQMELLLDQIKLPFVKRLTCYWIVTIQKNWLTGMLLGGGLYFLRFVILIPTFVFGSMRVVLETSVLVASPELIDNVKVFVEGRKYCYGERVE